MASEEEVAIKVRMWLNQLKLEKEENERSPGEESREEWLEKDLKDDVFKNTEAEVAVKVETWMNQLRLKEESREQKPDKGSGKEMLEEDSKEENHEKAAGKQKLSKEPERGYKGYEDEKGVSEEKLRKEGLCPAG